MKQILLCQHLKKCMENSMENVNTDLRVLEVDKKSMPVKGCLKVITEDRNNGSLDTVQEIIKNRLQSRRFQSCDR